MSPLRIPCRTAAERRDHRWTALERQAIEHELAAGRYQVVPRGRSGLPEGRDRGRAIIKFLLRRAA